MAAEEYTLDPQFIAGVDLVRRTGSLEFQIRYDEEQDPIVWVAVAGYRIGLDGLPNAKIGRKYHKVGAGMTPLAAVLKLCEAAIDGGTCAHCHRPTGFDADFDNTLNKAIAGDAVCWYMWDPELGSFRRGCE